ncbi:hypothetical protein B7P43_G16064 [Cryptotermes secundus]|uniref:Tc1-like transposase DDE domain-containing protein n=1 Tax=Cryptotermes secundus TaxID=105785 RepID=A0A2J7PTL2_9NEOP|nr:hypothetical protein B7P43_G16064 [Cryptotermes secundus]
MDGKIKQCVCIKFCVKLDKSATKSLEMLLPELWCDQKWLHHDNARAHMSLKTPEFMTNNTVIVPHPLYLLDLAPCDFTLFPKLKIKLKGQSFERVSDIQRQSQVVLDSIKENYFHSAFEAWKKQWDHCIHSKLA